MPSKRSRKVKDEVPNTLNDIELSKKAKKLDKKSFVSFDLDDEILESPFTSFTRPYPKEVSLAVDLLCDIHGVPERDEYVMPVLDSLIRTILSQNTTDKTSKKAFLSLKKAFPTWKDVLEANNTDIEDAIRIGGLAEIKTNRIKLILNYIITTFSNECGSNQDQPSLEFLRLMKTSQVKKILSSFKGVGPKTISCVLMFNLGRASFPVDTHVWHITKRLQWTPSNCNRETCHDHLNSRIPNEYKYPLQYY